MKYEILQRLSIPNLTIEAGTVKTVEDWQKEYGYNESYMKSNPAWFRAVPEFKVGDIMIGSRGICRITEIGERGEYPIRVILLNGIFDNFRFGALLPAPLIPDKLEKDGVKYKVKMKNGVPEWRKPIMGETYLGNKETDIVIEDGDKISATPHYNNGNRYILSPAEELFTLYKDLGSEDTPNFMQIETAIRDIYDRLKGEGR